MVNCYRCKKDMSEEYSYLDSPSFKNMKFACEDCCKILEKEEYKYKRKRKCGPA